MKGVRIMIKKLYKEWDDILLLENTSPYRFRTKLERILNHTIKFAELENSINLLKICNGIIYKLQYISDQSNQTSDGCLKSFIVLKNDMLALKKELSLLGA